eukprot:scaffold218614_cov35-Tisochrysis_lutea.AAC.1
MDRPHRRTGRLRDWSRRGHCDSGSGLSPLHRVRRAASTSRSLRSRSHPPCGDRVVVRRLRTQPAPPPKGECGPARSGAGRVRRYAARRTASLARSRSSSCSRSRSPPSLFLSLRGAGREIERQRGENGGDSVA